jgi:transaldolase / glucose-6-phosphate isomerase
MGIQDQTLAIDPWQSALDARLAEMEQARFVERFWSKDASLWQTDAKPEEISGFMGWLDVAEKLLPSCEELEAFGREVREAGFERAVLMGMGGSSLAPLVLRETLGQNANGLSLEVLDSTDPATVLRIERAGPIEKTLFIVASKSGTTAEPTAFDDYFWDKVQRVRGDEAGQNFVAITDPDTALAKDAARRGFRKIFVNFADIGGRFSALSYFGLVPGAVMGIDVRRLLERTVAEGRRNGPQADVRNAPGFVLGALLGTLAEQGRDKLTLLLPDELKTFGLWLEQLIAESTGKHGKGVFPIAGEEPGPPSVYGGDRVFAYLRRAGTDCTFLDMRIASLRDAGHPIVTIDLEDFYDLGREFMRWKIATAVAGAVLRINPFDQPNVQESKEITKRVIDEVEQRGSLAAEEPQLASDGYRVYGANGSSVEEALSNFIQRHPPGAYAVLMAYLTESPEMTKALERLQAEIRDTWRIATAMGYGPRFLHSTGQFHKGGPDTGLFIQLTAATAEEAPLPGRSYGFGVFREAQAIGDRQALDAHGRKVIRIDLGDDPVRAVESLVERLQTAAVAHR